MPGQATHGSTERYEIFKPLVPQPYELTANDAEFNYLVVARLKPEVSIRQAQSELDGIEKATAAADHLAIHLSVIVAPFSHEIAGGVSKPLWLLLAAVASVLLMACVNLANLQLRGAWLAITKRLSGLLLAQDEDGFSRVVLAENVLLGLGGGLGGIVFAVLGEKLFVQLAAVLPRLNEVHLSLPILAFALGLSFSLHSDLGFFPRSGLCALRRIQPSSQIPRGSRSISKQCAPAGCLSPLKLLAASLCSL